LGNERLLTLRNFALAAVVAQIPFELRFTLLGLSNLQWTFVLLVLLSMPALLQHMRKLAGDRIIQVGGAFITVQWVAALLDSPELRINAIKASIRFTAGFLLLLIVRISGNQTWVRRVWVIASAAAAAYALTSYAGLGSGWLFRTEEFYTGQIQRLSGSFEYPNTAAAYFAISLPLVWWGSFRLIVRCVAAVLLWCAIILTLSKGALIAASVVLIGGAVWSVVRTMQWRPYAVLLGLGAVAYIVLLPLNPYLLERINGPLVNNPLGAEYRTAWNYVRQKPGASDELPLRITNTGITTWRATGWRRIAIGGRWWNAETQKFLKLRPLITGLPQNVQPGQTLEVAAVLRTPDTPGKYVLVVELFSRDLLWFSQTGIAPALVQADVESDISRSVGVVDLSALYQRGRMPGTLTASVPRSELWKASLRMVSEHPFGIGPDNFRLEYGRYLGAARWDNNIYTNNLYLEVLTGTGVLGLALFLLMLVSIPWRLEPASMAIAIFLVHGLADVFIMATPIYFAFWILAGNPSCRRWLKNV
jgi:hypothetical protein